MIYEYECSNETCKNIEEVSMPMKAEHPESVVCSKCESKAFRMFKVNPLVPDHMKAGYEKGFNYEKSSQTHWKKYF